MYVWSIDSLIYLLVLNRYFNCNRDNIIVMHTGRWQSDKVRVTMK